MLVREVSNISHESDSSGEESSSHEEVGGTRSGRLRVVLTVSAANGASSGFEEDLLLLLLGLGKAELDIHGDSVSHVVGSLVLSTSVSVSTRNSTLLFVGIDGFISVEFINLLEGLKYTVSGDLILGSFGDISESGSLDLLELFNSLFLSFLGVDSSSEDSGNEVLH